jgi:hypothetical protein
VLNPIRQDILGQLLVESRPKGLQLGLERAEISCWLEDSCRLPVTGCRLKVEGCWFMEEGCWLLVAGCWFRPDVVSELYMLPRH